MVRCATMTLAAGIAAIVAGLLAALAGAHIRSGRYFDRPAIARNRIFDPLLSILKWLLVLAGLAILGRASRRGAALVSLALAVLWGYLRFVRGARFQGWLLRRDYVALRRSKPGVPEAEILHELAYRRNPRWGDELIEQMVIDYPTIDELAPIVVKMERGFRGFRSRAAGRSGPARRS